MEFLKILLEPQVMAAMVVAVATSYLIGAVEGEHRSEMSGDDEDEAAPGDSPKGNAAVSPARTP
jgi:hypothetical protein